MTDSYEFDGIGDTYFLPPIIFRITAALHNSSSQPLGKSLVSLEGN
jgi:hypothetical protein